MNITYEALLVGGAEGWHDGSGSVSFSFLGSTMPRYVKWDAGRDAFKLTGGVFVPQGEDFSMTAGEEALTRQALGAWDDVANIGLEEDTGFGDIVLGSSDMVDRNGRADTGLFGFVAGFPKEGDTTLSKRGDVWLNTNNRLQDNVELGQSGWHTIMHEIGHAFGLHHPNEDPNNWDGASNNNARYTVMSYLEHPGERGDSDAKQAWPLTPMVLDILAIQSLYGANTETRTADTSYFGDGDGTGELAYQYGVDGMVLAGDDGREREVILTIWDAGGTDLIDASDLSSRVKIDLRPGHFSSIGPLKNNIAVAAAVEIDGTIINYIEDAWGGAGGDKIKGNAGENSLLGGGGNDRLVGRGGSDVLGGEAGDDILKGGAGADEFLFEANGGSDLIRDFTDDEDVLSLDVSLWSGRLTAADVLAAYAVESGGNVVFTFDGGETLQVNGISDRNDLLDDITLF